MAPLGAKRRHMAQIGGNWRHLAVA